ncbi:hypothetical protein [Oryzomonas rubra]|uniref:Outer membrane protein beta-barrel domain-containing protein n=1 Tax=Oryzomonas rubra TaxID=2509454 RepID=A0A5A9XFD0_9BACT|nr:hypothetical protein [Oryzomonas rubra]KAA0890371.1 hypothetical protein ET418_11935 [Oryzomonas rubra]
MRYKLFVIIFVFLAHPALAGELTLLGGYGAANNPVEKTFAWQVQYMEGLGEHLAYSLSYLNQGHFISHHRDGNAANLWLRTNLLDRQLSLGAGVGGVFYYDTKLSANASPRDLHGWGTMTQVAATWYTKSRVFFQVQGYWIKGDKSFDSLSALAGIGYQLDAPPSEGPDVKGTHLSERTTDNELTAFGGETVVNIPGDGHSRAVALEYRRGLWRFIEWTAGALYEGRSSLIDRYGLTTQLWLAKPFLHDRIALGVGLGPYFAIDRRVDATHVRVPIIFSTTGSCRISQDWLIRATWDRIITRYDRDTDIFLGGIGYRF